MGIGSLRMMSYPTSMGFEPTRGDPNGLAVHRLNRSATMSSTLCLYPSVHSGALSIHIDCCRFHIKSNLHHSQDVCFTSLPASRLVGNVDRSLNLGPPFLQDTIMLLPFLCVGWIGVLADLAARSYDDHVFV